MPSENVVVMGLGYVGAAMAIALARPKADGSPSPLRVIGLDLPTVGGLDRVAALNEGRFPFETSDTVLVDAARGGRAAGSLSATIDPIVLAEADVIVVDVHLDVAGSTAEPTVTWDPFR